MLHQYQLDSLNGVPHYALHTMCSRIIGHTSLAFMLHKFNQHGGVCIPIQVFSR